MLVWFELDKAALAFYKPSLDDNTGALLSIGNRSVSVNAFGQSIILMGLLA